MLIQINIKEIIDCDGQVSIIVFKEKDGERELPVSISRSVSDKIRYYVEAEEKKMRPDIYDVLLIMLQKLDYSVNYAFIHSCNDGIFYAGLSFISNIHKNELKIEDIRPSDALIIAIKNNTEIFCEEDVFNNSESSTKSNKHISGDVHINDKGIAEKLSLLTVDEINLRLEIAIKEEDYKYAAKLRDERNKKLNT